MTEATSVVLFDFGGVVIRTPFELHGYDWHGPFDPSSDPLWEAMQRGEITEREYWHRRASAYHPRAEDPTHAFMRDLYEQDEAVRDGLFKLFATNHSPSSSVQTLRDLLCCLPQVAVPEALGYANLFRIIVMHFIDAHGFDVRSVKKSCVHIVHPDGRVIPFDTYNLFYRDELERTRLAPLRALHGEGVDTWA